MKRPFRLPPICASADQNRHVPFMQDLKEGEGLDNRQVFLTPGMGKELPVRPGSAHRSTQHPSYGHRGIFPRGEKRPWCEPNHSSF